MLMTLVTDYGLKFGNFIDLKPILDLALFSGCVKAKHKPLNIIMRNQGAENLSMDQSESATSDAYSFFKFGNLFFNGTSMVA